MALPADQTIVDERYRQAHGRELAHGGHTGHPAAYDDHVEVLARFHQAHPLQRAGLRRLEVSGLHEAPAAGAGDVAPSMA